MKFDDALPVLKEQLQTNLSRNFIWDLRNLDILVQNGAKTKFGQMTFSYFFFKIN